VVSRTPAGDPISWPSADTNAPLTPTALSAETTGSGSVVLPRPTSATFTRLVVPVLSGSDVTWWVSAMPVGGWFGADDGA
jgi:hypothetical protein